MQRDARPVRGLRGPGRGQTERDPEAFRFLAFDHATGELLAHGCRAIYALAQADLRKPSGTIEILNAGPAGSSLWHKQTSLAVARLIIDRLDAANGPNPYPEQTAPSWH